MRERRETELGTEVKCSRCDEFWPEDAEFFWFKGGEPHSWCKACYEHQPSRIAGRERARIKYLEKRGRAAELAEVPSPVQKTQAALRELEVALFGRPA